MNLGTQGVFCFTDALMPAQLTELAQRTEQLGYAALWYPEVLYYESFALGSFLLTQTKTLIVASGIANIYARDATAAKQGQHTLATLFGGRFLLGLGVSHVPLVEEVRGHQYRRPVATMRVYLDAMDKAGAIAPPPEESPPTVLAALGPQMTVLAAERTAGALSYNVTPDHTAQTREIIGPDKWLCVEQKVLLVTDPIKARAVARQTMAFYLPLTNYRQNWHRLGFREEDLADGGSDRFLDAMVAWGDEAAIRQRIQAHFDAGASHICIQALHPDGQPLPDLQALAALAPSRSRA
jgi:probable F420-dependent oxidoreductase